MELSEDAKPMAAMNKKIIQNWGLALFRLRDTDCVGVSERSTFSMHFVPLAELDSQRVWNWLADPLSRPENIDIIHRGSGRCGAGIIECMMLGFSIPRSLPSRSVLREQEKKNYQNMINSFGPMGRLESGDIGFGPRQSYELFRADARQTWNECTYELVTQGEGFYARLLAMSECLEMEGPKMARASFARAL